MSDILHEVEMRATPAEIFHALTSEKSPADWWSSDSVRMRLVVLSQARVAWRITDGPPDWIGTEIAIDLERDARGHETRVNLSHTGWRTPSIFLARCTTQWARFLLALKRFVETKEPNDLLV
jgi:hypothetical protein